MTQKFTDAQLAELQRRNIDPETVKVFPVRYAEPTSDFRIMPMRASPDHAMREFTIQCPIIDEKHGLVVVEQDGKLRRMQ
jgi:hypothetical protein